MIPGVAGGFTLIELLLVVAIVGILAALAVPNFLEAQTRAKFARVVGDLRTVATALEAYAVDANSYPLNSRYNNYSVPNCLTTPVAYVTMGRLIDPFTRILSVDPESLSGPYVNSGLRGDDVQLYTYQTIMSLKQAQYFDSAAFSPGFPYRPAADAIDAPGYNPGAQQRYGYWKLASYGPDGVYLDPSKSLMVNLIQTTFDVPYDPTNGTLSFGNIYRTHRSTVGEGTKKN